VPLSGHCYCGNKLNLTVYEASVKKYLEVTSRIGRDYGVSDYTQQRIRLIEQSITSIFGEPSDNLPASLDSFDEGGEEQPLELRRDPDADEVVEEEPVNEKVCKKAISLDDF
jgi:DNA polymerase II large subunit